MKQKSIIQPKVVFINICLLVSVLLSLEVFTRILYALKLKHNSFTSIVKVLLNTEGHHLDNSNLQRYPSPYEMFKGKPGELDHNSNGFRFNEDITKDAIRIAFFGGSTGYNGNPTLAQLLEQSLSEKYKKNFKLLNFSVTSSNHNQHIHSLIENSKNYQFDLVIFYGGYNETLQTAFYDPRPGYPYNFNIRNQLQPELQLLFKHSKLFQYIAKKYGLIDYLSGITQKPFTSEWNNEIIKNYFETLTLAEKITQALSTNKCNSKFIPVYQPYNFDDPSIPDEFNESIHQLIRTKYSNNNLYVDISDALDNHKHVYIDHAHVLKEGRNIISQNLMINSRFSKSIESCF